jgi:ribosomal protein S18 acetylase RimI-like enzyme
MLKRPLPKFEKITKLRKPKIIDKIEKYVRFTFRSKGVSSILGETPLFCGGRNMILYKWTDGNDKDFQGFYLKTEEYYSSIVGGIENRKGFIPYNISESITEVLIAYIDDAAVGCAGLKRYSEEDVEIKRVWVNQENRGQHIALDMMAQIEERAVNEGYKRTVLQTREIMEDAVGLYKKLGYKLIENYPPYDKLEGAICFAKELKGESNV